jgi:serine protease Do
VIAALAILCLPSALPAAADDTADEEQAAFAAAVDRVAPAVVQIETVGGLERVDGVLLGTGPTTGLAVDPGGYIISSAFNFIGKPASILVRLPDGARKPARLVATDHARMLVLLKIEAERPLLVCEIAPRRQMRVGQWTIAVGRTFQGDRPNMAVGILSALDRVWGRAIQTDAAVSPNNYGGPLVDVRGRVMGVLVPLSPQAAGEVAGMEWYDSGIGFAIPLEHIQQVLPRLKKGEDLYPGLAVAGGRIYAFDLNGRGVVIKAGPEGEVLVRNDCLGGGTASPFFAGNRMYVRNSFHKWMPSWIYCIEEEKKP